MYNYLDFEKPVAELEGKIEELQALVGRRTRRSTIAEEIDAARTQGGRKSAAPSSTAS